MKPNPDGQNDIWYTLDLLVSNLSLLGGLVMAYFCYKTPAPRSTSVKFMMAIALSDVLLSISNIMSAFESDNNPAYCATEAMIKQASFLLTIIFSTGTAIVAAKSSQPSAFNSKMFFVRTAFFGIVFSILFSLGPKIFPEYLEYTGKSLYCAIRYSDNITEKAWQFTIQVVYQGMPIIIGTILSLQAYLFIIKQLKTLPKALVKEMNVNVYGLLWYPFLLFVLLIPCQVYTAYEILTDRPPLWAKFIHLVLPHSIGFANAIVYGVQRKLYKATHADPKLNDETVEYSETMLSAPEYTCNSFENI